MRLERRSSGGLRYGLEVVQSPYRSMRFDIRYKLVCLHRKFLSRFCYVTLTEVRTPSAPSEEPSRPRKHCEDISSAQSEAIWRIWRGFVKVVRPLHPQPWIQCSIRSDIAGRPGQRM
jgi:hypothetical protein